MHIAYGDVAYINRHLAEETELEPITLSPISWGLERFTFNFAGGPTKMAKCEKVQPLYYTYSAMRAVSLRETLAQYFAWVLLTHGYRGQWYFT